MYKKTVAKVLPLIIIYISVSLLCIKMDAYAIESKPNVVLLYDNLYGYGRRTSDVLELYIRLRSNDLDVRLLQIDDLDKMMIPKDAKIKVISYSYDSKEKYNETIEYLGVLGLNIENEKKLYLNETVGHEELFIGINEVYPFSDLNKLMDVTEDLHNKGIEFICTIMPVYENYEFEAFDKYLEVIKYVEKKGGEIFIHYPVINEDGTYDTNPIDGLKKSIKEYQRRGLEIVGMTLSLDNLLTNSTSIQDLNVDFLLVTEPKKKVDTNLNLFKKSKDIDKYILLRGMDINSINTFLYDDAGHSKGDLVYLSIEDDVKKLNELLDYLYNKTISIRDFKVEEYVDRLNKAEDTKDEVQSVSGHNKTQLDKFKEEELRKIKGENLDKQQKNLQGYDLSKIVDIVLKFAGAIILVLIVQIIIGRRYDNKKNFKM